MKSFKFNLRGVTWKVEFGTEQDEALQSGEEDIVLMGNTLHLSNTIYILKTLSPESAFTTLWHEITHSVFAVDGGSANDSESKIDQELACNLVGDAMIEFSGQAKKIPWIFNHRHPFWIQK